MLYLILLFREKFLKRSEKKTHMTHYWTIFIFMIFIFKKHHKVLSILYIQ